MGDLRARQRCGEALGAYHPFWLRLGMEVVVGAAVSLPAGTASLDRQQRACSRTQLDAFARERFLNDPDLARQHSGNRATGGLHPPQYWVRTPGACSGVPDGSIPPASSRSCL